jgi:hypothetical protein
MYKFRSEEKILNDALIVQNIDFILIVFVLLWNLTKCSFIIFFGVCECIFFLI